jgi:hypothetical protein
MTMTFNAAPRAREGAWPVFHAVLWPVLFVLAGVVALVGPYLPAWWTGVSVFLTELALAVVAWLTDTMPVVAAGVVALLVSKLLVLRRPDTAALTVGLLGASATTETVLYAAVTASVGQVDLPLVWRVAVFGLSNTLLAAAWLAARGRRGTDLGFSVLAVFATWGLFSSLGRWVTNEIVSALGAGPAARFALALSGYVLTVLVIAIPALAAFLRDRVRPRRPRVAA